MKNIIKISMKILKSGKLISINPDTAPPTIKHLDAFLLHHNISRCFIKAQGGWYKLQEPNQMLFVNRVLYTMSYNEWLAVAKNNNFTSNIR